MYEGTLKYYDKDAEFNSDDVAKEIRDGDPSYYAEKTDEVVLDRPADLQDPLYVPLDEADTKRIRVKLDGLLKL